MWKKLKKHVGLDDTTSFLDHKKVGCTQRDCKPNENIIDQHREMFESRISAGLTEKLPGSAKPHAETVAWSYDVEGHAKKCVERYCELAKKRQCNKTKFQHLAWMITTSVCSQIVFFLKKKNLYIALPGLTFCDLYTNLQEQSQNGQEPVTDAWLV